MEFRSLSQQLSSQIADQYWDIITERFLKHSVNMRVLVGECVCDHWGGKEPWPDGYAEEPQRGEPFEQSLNPGGLQVWLAMLLSMLGHNLKGDQRAVPQSSKAVFLPPHLFPSLSLSLPLHTLSLSIFTRLLQTTVHFTVNSGQTLCHLCTKYTKYEIFLAQKGNNNTSDILLSNRFQMSFCISKHRFSKL